MCTQNRCWRTQIPEPLLKIFMSPTLQFAVQKIFAFIYPCFAVCLKFLVSKLIESQEYLMIGSTDRVEFKTTSLKTLVNYTKFTELRYSHRSLHSLPPPLNTWKDF